MNRNVVELRRHAANDSGTASFAPPPILTPLDERPLFGAELIAARRITEDQLRIALHEQTRHGGFLGQILCRLGYLTEQDLCAALAARSGLTVADPDNQITDGALLARIPQALAMRLQMLPLRRDHDAILALCADPYDIVARDQMQACFPDAPLRFQLTSPAALRQTIQRAYGGPQAEARHVPQSGEIAAWLTRLLADAVAQGASDIHLEPQASALSVRFRIDGVLHPVKALHRDFWPPLLQRLKIVAGVNIAESRLPQDGRFSEICGTARVDFRAGFIPTLHGEAVALRLLDPSRAHMPLAALGFADDHIATMRRWLARPEGLVLVTGPTGSGKSTTLNALLREVDHVKRNVMTLEDPVEYQFDGIRQSQVREKHGFGFAEGVRTMLRHDPDIILIGEIRDPATAQQAMRAAMTGHLVLSTLHTNNALGTIARLVDLGVPRYMLPHHLRGAVAQRLARVLCPACRGAGCPSCAGRGRKGRTVIAETLDFTPEIEELFQADITQERRRSLLASQDFVPMQSHGRSKVNDGLVNQNDLAAVVPF